MACDKSKQPRLARRLKIEFGIKLLAMRRDYEPEYGPTVYNQLNVGACKIIEMTISVLTGVMNANSTYARSLKGCSQTWLPKSLRSRSANISTYRWASLCCNFLRLSINMFQLVQVVKVYK
jgi:hypothetical protein